MLWQMVCRLYAMDVEFCKAKHLYERWVEVADFRCPNACQLALFTGAKIIFPDYCHIAAPPIHAMRQAAEQRMGQFMQRE